MKLILKSIEVTGEIFDMFGHISVKSVYHNNQTIPIEANYKFCLDPVAVIDSLKVIIGNRVIYGKVEEKKQAQKTYSNAIKENKRACILEKNEDQYNLNLGNIQPEETIVINYTYLTKLDMVNGKYMFVCPTNIGERYGVFVGSTNLQNTHIQHTVSESQHVIYFNILCMSKSVIKSIISSTASINCEITSPNSVNVRSLTCPSDGDFNFFIETDIASCVYSGTVNDVQYHMLTHKIQNEDNMYSPKEHIFLLDRSGSMSGQNIKDAIDALKCSIDLLRSDSYFNIISFGSSYSAMFSKSVQATTDNITKAKLILTKYSADMGGTEIYECLNAFFSNKIIKYETHVEQTDDALILQTCEKIIIFITDGQITNLSSVYNLIDNNNKENNIRIFSIGIGKDASRELIKTIADMTGGISQMVIDNESISDVSKSMIINTQKKYYKNIALNVNGDNMKYFGTTRIYPNQVISAFFTTTSSVDIQHISLTGYDQSKLEIKQWDVDTSDIIVIHPVLLKKIFANEMIKSGNLSDQEIIKLSVDNNIMNTLTSFVMVDTEICDEDNAFMIHVDIKTSSHHNCSTSAYTSDNYSEFEEVDTLDGGMDMFGGGGSSRSYITECDTSLLYHISADGNVDIEKIKLIVTSMNDINTLSIAENIDIKVMLHIVTILYIEKMNCSDIEQHIKNIKMWLSLNAPSIDYEKLSNKIAPFVKSPFSQVYVCGGDY